MLVEFAVDHSETHSLLISGFHIHSETHSQFLIYFDVKNILRRAKTPLGRDIVW